MHVFEHCQSVAGPLDELLGVLLNDLPRLAALLPNVERIEPLGARWVLGRLERRDRWVGRAPSGVARWVLPAEAVSWVVRSFWQFEPCVVSWVLEPMQLPFPVKGSGEVRLCRDSVQSTRVTLNGTVEIGGAGPSFLTRQFRRAEELLAAVMQRNLTSVFDRAQQALLAPPGPADFLLLENDAGRREGQPA